MNDLETAKQRRFDAELSEAIGDDMPRDLADRVVAGIQRLPGAGFADRGNANGEPSGPSRKRTVCLAAAGLLFGVVVVTSVARLRNEQTAMNTDRSTAVLQDPTLEDPTSQNPAPQDPIHTKATIAKLTNESLRPALQLETEPDLPPPGDALDRLIEIANAPSVNLIATATVTGMSDVDLKGCTPSEAIERIAAECNLQVTEQRGTLIVGSIGRSGRIGQRLTLNCKPVSVRSFFKQMHAKTGVNFVVADDVAGLVQCDIQDVPWQSAVRAICKQLRLEAIGCGTVMAIRPAQAAPQKPRLRFHFVAHPVANILSTWAKIGGSNLIIDASITGKLTVKISDLPFDALLHALADSVHAAIQAEGPNIRRIVPGPVHWSTDLTLERVTVAQALECNGGDPHGAASESSAKVSVFVRGASGRHMIDAIHTAARVAIADHAKANSGAGK
tara:strand:+ start:16551 stop:17885 length:1335 start_codon:yes stop_codon:yes gene_type:complete